MTNQSITSNRRRVAFRTFGCRLNQYDTETIRTLLEDDGAWQAVSSNLDADVYVVNTCSVTAQADASARKTIRRINSEHPDAGIVVTGCYAQRAPEELASLPGVSLVVGAADRARIAAEMHLMGDGQTRMAVSPIAQADQFLDIPISEMMERSRAYVKVQEGCNQSCSFCIVPQTRGRSRSREKHRVLEQVRALLDNGYEEIVLTGVHIGDYGLDLPGGRRLLAEVIESILSLAGVKRFRLSSIEPSTVSDDLIQLMAEQDRFARHFHIPFQSGSDTVLSRMQRGYSVEEFKQRIWQIAEQVPGCGIGTDVIAGFPGESEDDFAQTFETLVELPITYLHPFTYSVRPGSKAEAFGDQIPGDIKKRRTRSLKRLSTDKNLAFRCSQIGNKVAVLIETQLTEGAAVGLTDHFVRTEITDAAPPITGLVDVHIDEVTDNGLRGHSKSVQTAG